PVFFHFAALSASFFGPTLVGFRAVGFGATLFFIAAAVLLTRLWTDGDTDRMLLTAAVLVVTPQVNAAWTDGTMHVLAVAFQIAALAAIASGLQRQATGLTHGIAAGVFLTAAALTTPRSYPFVVGFFTASLLPGVFGASRVSGRRMVATAAVTLALLWLLWTLHSHGGPVRWFRYMAYIATHENTDVAILPGAQRELQFSWSGAFTSIVMLVGAFAAARAIERDGADRLGTLRRGMGFALLGAWNAFAITVVVLNYTFSISDYFVLPLLAVVLSSPTLITSGSRLLRSVPAAAFVVAAVVMPGRYARIAATWDARDPDGINDFIADHVPPGSVVVGPEAPYFFPVERSGSTYRAISPRSWADWARWVPVIEPESTQVAKPI
ncbi:MAG TPA: hypothetical protein VG871_02130, partial [Vicinamibacterales bacterium]|nr:hypothetical protein [Vicinamibacterales bacterium]